MNKKLSDSGKQILKNLLEFCTEPQHRMFKLMYGRNKGKRTIEETEILDINFVVDNMDDDCISHAITQCGNTIANNKLK